MTVLEALTRAVAAQFRGDPSGAGVVMAYLTNGADAPCYVSICRYSGPMGTQKTVVDRQSSSESFEAAILALAERFYERFGPSEKGLRDLRLALRGRK